MALLKISTVLILLAVPLIVMSLLGISWLAARRQKIRLYQAVQSLGDGPTIRGGMFSESPNFCFQRDGTVFTGEVRRFRVSCDYIIRFDGAPIPEKFFIRHDSAWAGIDTAMEGNRHPAADCKPVSGGSLPDGYVFYSPNTTFLLSFVGDEAVKAELARYGTDWGKFLKVSFDTGRFELTLHSESSGAAEKVRQVSETAIVFRDKICSAAVISDKINSAVGK